MPLRFGMGVSRFEDLDVWKQARLYCAEIGKINGRRAFFRHAPLAERMNKTALSIMENVAEGFERESRREFAQFVRIARGSTAEARSQLYAALDRGLFEPGEFERLFEMVSRIGQMLRRLRQALVAAIGVPGTGPAPTHATSGLKPETATTKPEARGTPHEG